MRRSIKAEESEDNPSTHVVSDKFFEIKNFDIIMPAGGNGESQCEDLSLNKKYEAFLWGINPEARPSFKECYNFLSTQQALSGKEGLRLVEKNKLEELPSNKWIVSFDQIDKMPVVAGKLRRIPFLLKTRNQGKEKSIVSHYVEDGFNSFYYLFGLRVKN